MKSRLSRADLVVKLARRKEDQAAVLLQQWRARVENQRLQLQELQNYEASYSGKSLKQQSVQALITERAFLTQLAEVIAEQSLRLSQMEHQYRLYTQHWQQLYKKRQLLEQHRGRLASEAVRALDKQWDQLCDELALNSHFSRGSN